MKLYLICGKARHGKDTTGNYIANEYEKLNKKVCRIQYGSYIKYYAEKYFGWDGTEETKPRELLQNLGTEIIRKKIDPMFHVNRIIQDIKVLSYFYDIFIITDIREPIEVTTPKKIYEDVVVIKIDRPNFTNELSSKEQKHYTEVAMDNYNNYDYIIINDGTLEDLNNKVIEMVKKEVEKDER